MLTTLLELVGLVLLVAAAAVYGGLALALAVAGALCLLVAWRLSTIKAPRT